MPSIVPASSNETARGGSVASVPFATLASAQILIPLIVEGFDEGIHTLQQSLLALSVLAPSS